MVAMGWGAAGYVALGLVGGQAVQLIRELVLERRRERQASLRDQRAWQREDALYDRDSRRARLLVADELDTIENHVGMLIRHEVWPNPLKTETMEFLPVEEWAAHKSQLAADLPDVSWYALAGLYYSTGQLRRRIKVETGGGRLSDEELESAKTMEMQAKLLHGLLRDPTLQIEIRDATMALIAADGSTVTSAPDSSSDGG
jgi:hypothetical protein